MYRRPRKRPCAIVAMACNGLQRTSQCSALPNRGEQRRIKTTRRKLSLGTLKSASPSDFGYKFPSTISSFLLASQCVSGFDASSNLSFRRMHMSKVWAPMLDALSKDRKGKGHFSDAEFEIALSSFPTRLCISHLSLEKAPHFVCFDNRVIVTI
jgi:hypothetical protein